MIDMGKGQPLTIYVCEDTKEHSEDLTAQLSLLEESCPMSVTFFDSAEELLAQLKDLKDKKIPFPDLLFLDIELPGMDGISLGKEIRKLCADIYLIFVTSYIEYAVKGYEANAFRYLVKPVSADTLGLLFADIRSEYQKRKRVSVKTTEGQRLLLLEDLIYISAEDKYTVLYTGEQYFISDFALKRYEEQLSPYGFFRIHRKYLINLYHYKGMQCGKLMLSDGKLLPVSKKRMQDFEMRFFQFLGVDTI
ncbi:MAG: LytTR family DNA-binding domain-containing protein [Lachnospiraceae bacterium]|nr:LytTR family DNA-binding domain-containing protein [Lachnospiraceae bacterium]